jgi:hypothetical protein
LTGSRRFGRPTREPCRRISAKPSSTASATKSGAWAGTPSRKVWPAIPPTPPREAALQRLKPADREAIVARIELQQSYAEVAVALDKPTADAARVAVTRALARLVKAMDDER